jgi:hypothetical protein
MRAWRKEIGASDELDLRCGVNCDGKFNDRKGLIDHLSARGKRDTCHKYTNEYLEELMKLNYFKRD